MMAADNKPRRTPPGSLSDQESSARSMRGLVLKVMVTSVALVLLLMYLMPLGYSIVTSLKSKAQVSDVNAPVVLPAEARTFEWNGSSYPVFRVPIDGQVRELALVDRGRASSAFVDPENSETGPIEWEGRWRTLDPVYGPGFQWNNYPRAFRFINFLQLLRNTLLYALVTTVAATSSAAVVAYGFAHFRFPLRGVLFMVLISTIILPSQATLESRADPDVRLDHLAASRPGVDGRGTVPLLLRVERLLRAPHLLGR